MCGLIDAPVGLSASKASKAICRQRGFMRIPKHSAHPGWRRSREARARAFVCAIAAKRSERASQARAVSQCCTAPVPLRARCPANDRVRLTDRAINPRRTTRGEAARA